MQFNYFSDKVGPVLLCAVESDSVIHMRITELCLEGEAKKKTCKEMVPKNSDKSHKIHYFSMCNIWEM